MLGKVDIVSRGPAALLPEPSTAPPGDPHAVVDALTLLEFARCPKRLVSRQGPPEPALSIQVNALRHVVLAPAAFDKRFRVRPDTYTVSVLTCPSCKSTSAASVCRKCGLRRANVTSTRPWASGAESCRLWREQAERDGVQPLRSDQQAALKLAFGRLAQDPYVAPLLADNLGPLRLEGAWHDAETGLDIPVQALVDFVPPPTSQYWDCIAFLWGTQDASPDSWTRSAYYGALQMMAALALDLFNAVQDEPRRRILFALSETNPPFEVGRRLLTPDLVQQGRAQYQQWLTRYAQAVHQKVWPGYDPDADAREAWTPVDVEPWMKDRPGSLGFVEKKVAA